MPFFLGVEGVAGHQGSFELGGGVLVEEALGDGQFAIILFAAVGALGEGVGRWRGVGFGRAGRISARWL